MLDDFFPIKDPVLVFALVAFLILVAPIIMGRWRMPGMVGLLLSGAFLGPNALGILARDQSFILFGTVGLLYIMFSAALEIDMAVLRRYRIHSLIFGLFTFAIPMSLGFAVSHFILGFGTLAAILLASTFASHTLLTYPIASRLGLNRNPAVTTAVGGTIVTDTLALLVLAAVASASRGETDPDFWYRMSASLLVYVMAILIGLPILARWFFRNVGRDGVAEFVFVLAAVFGCAALSHLAGSEPIVGAFLAGLALNRLIPHHSTLMNRIQFTGEAVFVPFFLLSVGMLLDFRMFTDGLWAWAVAIAMIATVLAAKWLAAHTTRLFLRFDYHQAQLIFALSVPQAAATLAAIMVGHSLGLFDDTVVNGAIMMILATCLVAPIVADRHGRALAMKVEANTDTEREKTVQRVLVACSNPATARPLLELAILLREPDHTQPIYPVTVVEEGSRAHDEIGQAERSLEKTVAQLSAAEVPAHPVTRIDLNVGAGLLRARRELRGTELIMGWRGHRTPHELFFGSLLEHLLSDPDYALFVARIVEPLNTCQRIVFVIPPLAIKESAFVDTLTLAHRLGQVLGTSLLVVTPGSEVNRIRGQMGGIKQRVETHFLSLESWRHVRRRLLESVMEGDFLLLYGARPGALAWTPLNAALPPYLAGKLPHHSLLTLYPPEPGPDEPM